jgi:SAM-dependent methyltransferase
MTDNELLEFWKGRKAPARPSQHMLTIYEAHINELGLDESGAWAILGCTPELRTLAGKYNRPLTCIDRNAQTYSAFRPLCEPPEQEKFVHSDWLETDLPLAFDLILGDGSMVMLPQDRHQGFIDSIHRMLKPGGYAIMKILSSENWPFKSAEEILDWFRANHRENLPMNSLRTHLGIQWMDWETMAINKDVYAEKLEEIYQNKIVTPEEYQDLLAFTMKTDLYCSDHNRFEQMLGDSFEILSIERPTDFFSSEYYPMYTIRKN